ncbi:hypothetical protein [Egbenema bharatensis]|uniref:hypothetical protein n=1 Tax=Egbenema bharatensis TaxID=3463334 RepID=UPI003A88649F
MNQRFFRWSHPTSSLCRLFLAPSLLGASIIVFAGPAFAQATWIPQFNAEQRVYIAPSLSNHPISPVSFPNLEPQITDAAAAHDLEVYVVATEQGEPVSDNTNPAVRTLDQLVARWRSDANFPVDDYLIILWVRRSDDVNRGWVAANGGNELRAAGLTAERLSQDDGPVIPALRQYMPNDPQGAIVAIVENVNQELDASAAQQQAQAEREAAAARQRAEREQQWAEVQDTVATYGPPGAVGTGSAIGILWLALRYRRRRTAAQTAVENWQERLNNANELYLKLYDRYFDFLRSQTDWTTKFQGRTRTQYESAVTDFTDLTVRLEAANHRLQAAQSDIQHDRFPLIAGFDRAVERLTNEPVEVTEQELPLEMANLFSGMVPKTIYAPEELLAAMSDLFDRANSALAEIVQSVEGIEQNHQNLLTCLEAIQQSQLTLMQLNLPFSPYESRLQQVQQEQQRFTSLQTSDPLAAYPISQTALNDAQSLQADLQRAIELHQALLDVQTPIDTAIHYAQTIRQQIVDDRYPRTPDEPGTNAQSQPFTLLEINGNPDDGVQLAQQQQQAGFTLLRQGQLDQAEEQCQTAIHTAQQAYQLVDEILAAKTFIEENVPPVRHRWSALMSEIPDATQALTTLQREFIPQCYGPEPQKLERAKQVSSATPATLSQIRQDYVIQRYLKARRDLEALSATIQTSRHQLTEIHGCLTRQQQFRQHSRDRVAECGQCKSELDAKLRTHDFTTAAAVEADYQQRVALLNWQQINTAQAMTDWEAAASDCDQLYEALQAIDQTIDQQQQAYEQAVAQVANLEQALTSARLAVNDPMVRVEARQQLLEAETLLQTVQSAITQPKSDWDSITARANQGIEQANTAQQKALSDRQSASEAQTALSNARTALRSADRHYGHGVSVNLYATHQLLEQAASLFQDQSYEAVIQRANQVAHDARSAEREALNRVAIIVAEIRRREEEERRRQQQIHSSSSWNSHSGGSFGGGGGGYGGGSSGGGGYGGGGSGGGSY